MTPARLKDLVDRLPELELAVYADIGSRTVLGSHGALRYPQEYVDALCECAAQLFEGPPEFEGAPLGPVLFLGPAGGRAFFRAPSEPSEALACICGAGVDAGALVAACGASLAQA